MKQILICLLSCSLLLLSGCYTEKKAEAQTERALDEYPLTVADIIRKEFPCVTTDSVVKETVDSSKWIESRDAAIKKYLRANRSIDSLKAITAKHSEELKNACKDYQDIIDEQATELMNLNDIVATGLKPVIKWREVIKKEKDMAEVNIANAERNAATNKANLLQAENDEMKAQLDGYKKKHKGNIEILIPLWLIIALAVVFGLTWKFNLIGKVKGFFGK